MKRTAIITALALLLGFTAAAQDLGAIKQRMAARLPVISELKEKQTVGENNKGYLEFLPGKSKDKKDVVEAENADRKKIYEVLAARTGTTAEVVGKRRAEQIREQSDPGIMIQDVDGNWREK